MSVSFTRKLKFELYHLGQPAIASGRNSNRHNSELEAGEHASEHAFETYEDAGTYEYEIRIGSEVYMLISVVQRSVYNAPPEVTPPDETVDAFSFTDLTDQQLDMLVYSNTITVSGLDPRFKHAGLIDEDFSSSSLSSPWYDVTDIAVDTMPGTTSQAYYQKWVDGTRTEGGLTSRALFTEKNEFWMGFDLATSMETGHIVYMKTNAATDYEGPTNGGSVYFQVYEGKFDFNCRDTAGSWNSGNVGTTVINDGTKRRITAYVKLNDPGQNNGIVKIWIDDVLEMHLTTVRMITQAGELAKQILIGPTLDAPTSGTAELWVDQFQLTSPAGAAPTVDPRYGAALTISGNDGAYSLNGGSYSQAATTVYNGDEIILRQTTSSSNSTQTDVVLTIDGQSDTWSVTTIAGGGGGGDAEYYVDGATGDDANAGTSAAPFATIQHGYDQCVAGDTVYVRTATYTENNSGVSGGVGIILNRQGSLGAPITIRNQPGHSPIIDQGDVSTSCGFICQSGGGGSYNTVRGFEIRNCDTAGVFASPSYDAVTGLTIYDNIIHDIDGPGGGNINGCKLWGAVNPVVQNCTIYDIKVGGSQTADDSSGIGCYDVTNLVASHNEIYQCRQAFYLKRAQSPKVVAGVMSYNTLHDMTEGFRIGTSGSNTPWHDLTLHHNEIYNCTQGIHCENYTPSGSRSDIFKVYNNTVDVSSWALTLKGWDAVQVYNNILEGSKQIVIRQYPNANDVVTFTKLDFNCYSGSFSCTDDLYGGSEQTFGTLASWQSFTGREASGINQSADWKNTAGGDYRLNASSPCVYAGENGAHIGARDYTGFYELTTFTGISGDSTDVHSSNIVSDDSGNVYVGYKSSSNTIKVIKYSVVTGTTETVNLTPLWTGSDTYHSGITIALDPDGYLHVFGPMHWRELDYYRADAPNSVTGGFTRYTNETSGITGTMNGTGGYPNFDGSTDDTTYAYIHYDSDYNPMLTYRMGVGTGYTSSPYGGYQAGFLGRYNKTTELWEMLGGTSNGNYDPKGSPAAITPCFFWTEHTHSPTTNSYQKYTAKPICDADGSLLYSVVQTRGYAHDGGWGRDVLYYYSDDDGVTWKTADGSTVTGDPICQTGTPTSPEAAAIASGGYHYNEAWPGTVNGKPCVSFTDKSAGNRTKVAIYESGSWNIKDCGGGSYEKFLVDSNNVMYRLGDNNVYTSDDEAATWKAYSSGLSGSAFDLKYDVRRFMKTNKVRFSKLSGSTAKIMEFVSDEYINEDWVL